MAAHKQINKDKSRQGIDEKLGGSDPAQRQEKRKAYHLYIYTDRSGKIRKNDNTEEGNGEGLNETQFSSRGSRQPRKTD